MILRSAFIDLKISLIDRKDHELGIENPEEIPVSLKIRPEDICAYHKVFGKDDKNDWCKIYLRSGEYFIIEMTINEFEQKLNEVYKFLQQ